MPTQWQALAGCGKTLEAVILWLRVVDGLDDGGLT
jgi:hypothetical protein